MGKVVRFPDSALARVDRLCRAVAEQHGTREQIVSAAHPGRVSVRVAGLELSMSPEEARGFADDLAESADDAEAKLLQRGGRRGV